LIYLDSSVALAHLFGEGKVPSAPFWTAPLVSSRLLEYEVWRRIHARGAGAVLFDAVEALFELVSFTELARPILARALKPWPTPVRTLDGLHLATIEFLRAEGDPVELASYDHRLLAVAGALGIAIVTL